MQAEDIAGPLGAGGHLIQIQGGGVAGQNRARLHDGIQPLEYLLLEVQVFVHRLDDQICIRHGLVGQDAAHPRQPLVPLLGVDAPAAHHAPVVGLDDLEALVQGRLIRFQHGHRNAGVGEAHGDAAAHQPAADGGRAADGLVRRIGRQVRDAPRPPLGEEQVDHRRALLVVVAAPEVLPLDAHPVLETLALHRRPHGFEGHLPAELPAQPPGQIGFPGLEDLRVGAVRLELVAPVARQGMGAAGRRLALGEGDGRGDEVAFQDLIDQPQFQRLLGIEGIAGQDGLHGRLRADQARQALRAAAAGQKAQLDFRQPQLGFRRGHPVMAMECKLQAAAEGDAIDGGHHRLGAGLDHGAGRRFRLGRRVFGLAKFPNVVAGAERPPLADDHQRLRIVAAQRRLQMPSQAKAHASTQRIQRRIVDGEQRNPVAHLAMNRPKRCHAMLP